MARPLVIFVERCSIVHSKMTVVAVFRVTSSEPGTRATEAAYLLAGFFSGHSRSRLAH